VHLAVDADVTDTDIVCDQRETPRPPERVGEAGALRHHGAQSVSGDDDTCAALAGDAVVERVDADDALRRVADHIRYAFALGDARARCPGSIEKDQDQDLAPNGQSAVAI